MFDKIKKSNTDRLGNEKISRLLFRLSIPATFSLIVAASYNLIDTIWVGRLGVAAITSLSIIFPLQMILSALAQGTGIGVQSFISRMLGKGDTKKAGNAAISSMVLAFIFWIISASIGLVFAQDIVNIFSSDPQVITYGSAYMRIIFSGSITLFFLRAGLNILRAQGNYFIPMVLQIITVISNIILDPILIFGWFGFPALGVEGAGYATVTARLVGCILISLFLLGKQNDVPMKIRNYHGDKQIFLEILTVGVPTILVDLLFSTTFAGINKILDGLAFSTVLVAAVGIYYRLQSIIFTPVVGLSRSLITIIGYNYGAKKFDRVWQAVKLSLMFSFIISFIVFLLFELAPTTLIGIFNSNPKLLEFGSITFQRISIFIFIGGPALIAISFFQAIGRAMKLFTIMAIRQFILFFPLLYLFSRWFGHPTIWYAFPISDGITIIIGIIIIYYDLRQLKLSKSLPIIKYKKS